MKLARRIFDIIFGVILAAGSGYLSYYGLKEMITEGSGWYDHEDYMFTVLLIIVLWIFVYQGIRFVVYPLHVMRLERRVSRQSESLKVLDGIIEEGMAKQSMLEDELLSINSHENKN